MAPEDWARVAYYVLTAVLWGLAGYFRGRTVELRRQRRERSEDYALFLGTLSAIEEACACAQRRHERERTGEQPKVH